MIKNFEAAGYPVKYDADAAGKTVRIYALPDGSTARVMPASPQNPLRTVFQNANGEPVNPLTGKPPQPIIRPITPDDKKAWKAEARSLTHFEQEP